jgi:hypothetical protein
MIQTVSIFEMSEWATTNNVSEEKEKSSRHHVKTRKNQQQMESFDPIIEKS